MIPHDNETWVVNNWTTEKILMALRKWHKTVHDRWFSVAFAHFPFHIPLSWFATDRGWSTWVFEFLLALWFSLSCCFLCIYEKERLACWLVDGWDGLRWSGLGWLAVFQGEIRAWLVCLWMKLGWVAGLLIWTLDGCLDGRMGGLGSINGVCNGRMDDFKVGYMPTCLALDSLMQITFWSSRFWSFFCHANISCSSPCIQVDDLTDPSRQRRL